MYKLLRGEKVEADKGYRGEADFVRCNFHYVSREDRRAKSRARARHETVNKRIKNFNILTRVYRHRLSFHKHCFRACAVLTQLSFEAGERPWQIYY